MKKVILLIAMMIVGGLIYAQELPPLYTAGNGLSKNLRQRDIDNSFMSAVLKGDSNTYVTHKSETISGNQGDVECDWHEWFSTHSDSDNGVVRKQGVSYQCVNCGKQYAIVNTWTTRYYEENEGNEE